LNKRHVSPCSEEVTNERLRRIALHNAKFTTNQSYSQNQEIAGGGLNQYNQGSGEFINPSSFGGSLSFKKRCVSSELKCNLAARNGVTINEYSGCSGPVRFGSMPGSRFKCSSSFLASSPMQQALTSNLPSCVKRTARSLGLGEVDSMNVVHYGCFAYRNMRAGSRLSNHASGAAIDIAAIILNFSAGGSQTISMHVKDRAKDERFYNLLHQCWSQAGGRCSCGLKYNQGSPGIRRLHNDHMHLVYNCNRRGSC